MGITITHEKWHDVGEPDIYCPTVHCDHCYRKIDTADEGAYAWEQFVTYESRPLRFYHKECLDHVGRRLSSMPLADFLHFFKNNLKNQPKLKKLQRERAEQLAESLDVSVERLRESAYE